MAFNNLVLIDNPLAKHYLTGIRDRKTSYSDFREYVNKLSLILAYESAAELSPRKKTVQTPLAKITGTRINEEIVLVPVLRAGLGLMDGFLQLFPKARVGHIGVYRNEKTLKPVSYYFKFPKVKSKKDSIVFVLDPMLATGGSICHSLVELKKLGVKKIIVASLVSAPEGVKTVNKLHAGIKIYTCALDKKLNNIGYIVPGLGDAGDRMFGT